MLLLVKVREKRNTGCSARSGHFPWSKCRLCAARRASKKGTWDYIYSTLLFQKTTTATTATTANIHSPKNTFNLRAPRPLTLLIRNELFENRGPDYRRARRLSRESDKKRSNRSIVKLLRRVLGLLLRVQQRRALTFSPKYFRRPNRRAAVKPSSRPET